MLLMFMLEKLEPYNVLVLQNLQYFILNLFRWIIDYIATYSMSPVGRAIPCQI